jgi:hypothetical protein
MPGTAFADGESYRDDGGSLDINEPDFDMDEIEESLENMEEAQSGGALSELHRMGQMGAKRIGSLAIGIGVVGIVLNQMSNLDIVANSTGVIDVSSIFQTAGAGLNLLVVGVIIAAAAVLLSLWSGF